MDPLAAIGEFLRAIIREEIQRALKERQVEPLWLDTKQAAALLNLPPSKVASMARSGELRSKKFGPYVRFNREEIEQLCTQTSRTASAAPANGAGITIKGGTG